MNILLTGAHGQLGKDCVRVFGRDPQTQLTCTDLPEVDIADAACVDALLTRVQPDAVINCAAYTAVDKAESDAAACDRANRLGPAVLGAACAARGIRLLHVSTDYVFSGDRSVPEPWLEGDDPAPRTVYGETKLAGERALLESGADVTILRTAWLYGIYGRNFPRTMLKLARKNPEDSARVVADQWGCPTWSFQLAEQLRAVLTAPNAPRGVCHAVNQGYTNWFHFAETFLTLLDVPHHFTPCTTADYPTPAQRPANSILRDARLEEAGLLVMQDWRIALSRFVSILGTAWDE